jgi:hypothetical protein
MPVARKPDLTGEDGTQPALHIAHTRPSSFTWTDVTTHMASETEYETDGSIICNKQSNV